ncbi:MAG: sigma-70 family RNA polymerase sigma factor [Planctomycetota bacterium]
MPTASVEGSRSGGFEQYAGQVYRWAYRFMGRHHDALDVVQDVFLRWDQQCTQGRPSQPRGWLRRVTLNRAIDMCRKRQADVGPVADTMDLRAADEGAVEMLDRATLREDFASALDRLSDIQRSVLVAKVYDEMTFAAIAAEMNVAVSTVKTHYLRAVQAVRDRLRPRWADEVQP